MGHYMGLEHERLISLIEFAKESAKLRSSPVYNVANHLFYEYEHNLQGLPGLHFNVGGEEDEIWLVVDRLRESNAPIPKNELLQLWLEISNTPDKDPTIKEAVEFQKLFNAGFVQLEEDHKPTDIERLVLLEAFDRITEVKDQFKAYIETQWKPWSIEEKRRRKTIQLYGKLFTLKQQLEGSITDTQIEIAWGVGIAVWNMNSTKSTKITYPLVTRLVEISVNEITMDIEIRPCDMEARLELDIYTAADNPGTIGLENAFKEFTSKSTQTFSPFDRGTFEGVLRSAVTSLDSKGVYWAEQTTADDRKIPSASEELKVTDTWVLIARPRSKSLFVQDLERFQSNLEELGEIALPKALLAVLTNPSQINQDFSLPSFRGISMVRGYEENSNEHTEDVADLYFPMPFNDEQVRIVQMLERYDGVVVQGPPGTGKTHTIANIIAHYFAMGKRVLVTSMKEPALAVLRDKLPEEISPLAISLLSNEQEGMKQFEYAISKIASEIQTLDKTAYKKEIFEHEQLINELHSRLSRIDRSVTDWAKKNLNQISIDGDFVSPDDAAKEVVQGQGQYEWLKDKLLLENIPLFGNADIARLREARREVTNDMHYLGLKLPEISSFYDIHKLLSIHEDLSRHAELEAAVDSGDLPPLVDSQSDTIKDASILLEKIKSFFDLTKKIKNSGEWHETSRKLLKQSPAALTEIVEIFDLLGEEIQEAVAERNHFLKKPVSIPKDIELDEEILKAIQNKAAGKSAFGFIGFIGKGAAKKTLDEIRVLTSPPESEEDWQYVQMYVELQKRFRELVTRWNGVASELEIKCFETTEPSNVLKAAEYFSLHLLIRNHIELEHQIIHQSRSLIPSWGRYEEIEENQESLQELQTFLDSHIRRHRLSSSWTNKEQFQQLLSDYDGKIVDELREFGASTLGNPLVSNSEMQTKWSNLIDELKRIHGLRSAFADVLDICSRIEESGAKVWASELRTHSTNTTVDQLLPNDWQNAWRLRRLATHLEKADAREELKKLSHNRKNDELLLTKTYRDIVAKRTWLKLAENATPDIRSALEAFRTAISKTGKGTGKRAAISRQNARRASERANHVIPCWIMPHWRVSEALPPQLGCFDLVIIDEASQSDFSALPALLRAKKVLIVGDDKQVSPDGAFVEIDKIKNLMERYLTKQVDIYRAQMDPGQSIYDLFKVVFAQSGIMLKEHFRCVGSIIEYSKREFYNHELKPVRLPRVSERLDPPLVDILVEDGYRKGDINMPEARFIVNEIKKICADEQMQHRTIGVVSLLAEKQALKIWEMLEDELGPEKIRQHEIACGDARTFQGKERDIMFLSMVVSEGNAHAQTKNSTAQRFNVAASRARDRMYLVRSVELAQLSPSDKLRRNLIAHFATPCAQDEQRVENLRTLCESDFEREIYDILTERGYRVIPQVKVGGFRIDMVVEGHNDLRLAIECDGDRYHGADRWESDMNRQRILERVGWQFWRCFASEFIRNRREVVDDLITTLTERGITPIGSDTAPRSIYTEHRRVVAFPFISERISEQVDFDLHDGFVE